MPIPSRRAAGRRRVLAGLLTVALAVLGGVAGPAGAASASSPHADGTHRAPQALVAAGSAKARASTIMCTKVAAKAGFSFTKTVGTSLGPQPQLVVAVAVAMAESGCVPHAKNVNDDGGSVDRGLWQMNSRYHPEVSDSCAYQIQCNANAAWRVSDHGARWSPWSAYNNGSWKTYVGDARAAISGGFTFLLGSQGAGTCLAADRAHHADGAAIWQWKCDPADDYQQWTVTSEVGSAPILRNLGAGTCLAWDGTKTGDGAPVAQQACDAADAGQQVGFVGTGRLNVAGEADALIQGVGGNICLVADSATGDGKPVRQGTCSSGNRYQMWN
ncbi:ricin-type beta-trefoil lectin domain protein [Catenulispora subtropica]|uniref:Ricin B lectin n=1 Tax=Catenulispora subtropica TaxID=450798 RepID=A0ABN2S9M9_9ACTN